MCPFGMQATLRSDFISGIFFHENLVIKHSVFNLIFLLIQEDQKSVTGEKSSLGTGNLPVMAFCRAVLLS